MIGGAAQTVAGELFLRVAVDRLEQRPLVAPVRHADLDLRFTQLGQPPFVQLSFVGVEGHEHVLGDAQRRFLRVHTLEHAVDELRGRQVFDLVDDEPLAADDATLAHEEDLHGGFELVVGDADHVDVLVAVGHDLLLLDGAAHTGQPIAQPGRLLELHAVRRREHLLFEALDDFVGIAVEEGQQLVDEHLIRRRLDLAHARPRTLLDVEQQARSTEAFVMRVLVLAARADRERAQQQVQRLADRVRVAVGAEVAHTLLLGAPHHHGPRPLLVQRDRQERIRLVVDQPDVESGPVLLDEVELEHQASSSLRTSIHSTVVAVVTICAVRGGSSAGFTK